LTPGSHETRILGFRNPYERSTIRLTITNTIARKSTPPWITG